MEGRGQAGSLSSAIHRPSNDCQRTVGCPPVARRVDHSSPVRSLADGPLTAGSSVCRPPRCLPSLSRDRASRTIARRWAGQVGSAALRGLPGPTNWLGPRSPTGMIWVFRVRARRIMSCRDDGFAQVWRSCCRSAGLLLASEVFTPNSLVSPPPRRLPLRRLPLRRLPLRKPKLFGRPLPARGRWVTIH